MKYVSNLAFAAVILLVPLRALSFCTQPQPRLVRAEYFDNELVVEATLVRTHNIIEGGDPEAIIARVYTLRVNRTFRGEMVKTIRVYEENATSRAAFRWVLKRGYLLFLDYDTSEKAWELDGCGNSGLIDNAGSALHEISAIKAMKYRDGLIQGIVSDQALASPIPEVRVEAHGTAGNFAAETDKKGEFRINVPPGQYTVRAIDEDDVTYATFELSYNDPRKVRLEPGSAVQIQFIQVANPPAR
ncbi:MAG: carboxypeptidase-like regulatory domain-containing protein [Terracidiphilus sp.]